MFFRQHENYKLNGVGASSTCTNTMDAKSVLYRFAIFICFMVRLINKPNLKVKEKSLTIKDIVLNFIDKSLNKQSTKIDKILDNSLSLSLIGA